MDINSDNNNPKDGGNGAGRFDMNNISNIPYIEILDIIKNIENNNNIILEDNDENSINGFK